MSHISENTNSVKPILHHFNLKTARLHEMIVQHCSGYDGKLSFSWWSLAHQRCG